MNNLIRDSSSKGRSGQDKSKKKRSDRNQSDLSATQEHQHSGEGRSPEKDKSGTPKLLQNTSRPKLNRIVERGNLESQAGDKCNLQTSEDAI